MGWGVEDKSFFLLNVPLVMQLKKKKKKQPLGIFLHPFLTLLEYLLSQRFLFHKLCAVNIPIEQIPNSSFAF